MSSRAVSVLLPLMAGAMLAAQAPINARLRSVLDSTFASAVVSFATGLVVLAAALAVAGDGERLAGLGRGPWWAYLGGLLGAVFVLVGITVTPTVGVTVMFVAVVAGQVAMATLIDRYGWLGTDPIRLSWERVSALVLMAVALVLLARR